MVCFGIYWFITEVNNCEFKKETDENIIKYLVINHCRDGLGYLTLHDRT